MCPHCGQSAPMVYRGVTAYCSGCGHVRIPLTGNALHLAGQPSRVGSLFARIFGWIVIGVGLSVALGIGAVASLLWPTGFVGLAIALPIAVLSLVLGGFALRGSKKLDASGAAAQKGALTQAVFALASQRGGSLTARDAAAALDLPVATAEELLQSLAKEQYDAVASDVDDSGTLVYRFVVPTRVRVDPEVARSPNRAEWERLEAEEAERRADPARARPR